MVSRPLIAQGYSLAEEVANTKDSYNYKKAYTLEDFYGMLIK